MQNELLIMYIVDVLTQVHPGTVYKFGVDREVGALVQHFAEEFRKENGDIVCRRLLGLEPMVERQETPMPSERTEEYYKKRPCVEYVAESGNSKSLSLYV